MGDAASSAIPTSTTSSTSDVPPDLGAKLRAGLQSVFHKPVSVQAEMNLNGKASVADGKCMKENMYSPEEDNSEKPGLLKNCSGDKDIAQPRGMIHNEDESLEAEHFEGKFMFDKIDEQLLSSNITYLLFCSCLATIGL